jgi:hypothetical protein
MPDQLHWETVTPLLKATLTKIMEARLFDPFRLVGGTSLSLQLGHRMSIDLDLFTDAPYRSIDFPAINSFLKNEFSYVSDLASGPVGVGVSFLVGDNPEGQVKLDIYYTDSFIQPAIHNGIYRLATCEEIIAMKMDIVQRGARKKDFWDLHELLTEYSPQQMIALHAQRYPHTHDEDRIKKNWINFTSADNDFDPICLQGKHWELVKLDLVEALQQI